VVQDISGAHGS